MQHALGAEGNKKRGLSAVKDVAGDRGAAEINMLAHLLENLSKNQKRLHVLPHVSYATV